MSRVLDQSASKGTTRVVLLVIADHASDDGSNAYPRHATIASKANTSVSSVKRSIAWLVEHGELQVQVGAGGSPSCPHDRRPNRYRVTLNGGSLADGPEMDSPDLDGPEMDERGFTGEPDGGSTVTYEPSMNHPEPSKKTVVAFDADFSAVWEIYPRRIERSKALKAYTARRKAGICADDLLAATRNYATSVIGRDPSFIKHGATFFGPDAPFSDYVAGIPEPISMGAGDSRNMRAINSVVWTDHHGNEVSG